MTTDGSWALIDLTRPAGGGPTGHADALTRRLVSLGVDETTEFVAEFHAAGEAWLASDSEREFATWDR